MTKPPPPTISVVVPAYEARAVIDGALVSLFAQDLQDPFEVIVVDSGSDGCADHVEARFPEVKVVQSRQRLMVGAACNAGLSVASGKYVAFLPADCVARPDWLRRRLAKHREGYAAVGGSVTNGTPRHLLGSAGYYLEYSAVIPSARIIAEQSTPHSLSYARTLFERFGQFPVDTGAGEDTVFNRRCVEAGVAIGFDAGASIAHRNPTRLTAYLKHQYDHGRSLARCAEHHASWSPTHPVEQPLPIAAARIYVTYPARRWLAALSRVARGRPRSLPSFLVLTPLVLLGAWAASTGLLVELRELRRRRRLSRPNGAPQNL